MNSTICCDNCDPRPHVPAGTTYPTERRPGEWWCAVCECWHDFHGCPGKDVILRVDDSGMEWPARSYGVER